MPRRKRTIEAEDLESGIREEEALPEDLDVDEAEDKEAPAQEVSLAEEPLFSTLLRHAVAKLWPDDAVMLDFVTHVAGPLSEQLGTIGAKGGDFVVERAQEGLEVKEAYKRDQSFRAHLINGLFPVLHIAHALKTWGAPRMRYLDRKSTRLNSSHIQKSRMPSSA